MSQMLRNWERRREPRGPARALLRAVENDPEAVLKAAVRRVEGRVGTDPSQRARSLERKWLEGGIANMIGTLFVLISCWFARGPDHPNYGLLVVGWTLVLGTVAAGPVMLEHRWGTLWILLPGVVVHLYPVLLQRSIMLRLQPVLDKSGAAASLPQVPASFGPAFGYVTPHSSNRANSTLLNSAVLSAQPPHRHASRLHGVAVLIGRWR